MKLLTALPVICVLAFTQPAYAEVWQAASSTLEQSQKQEIETLMHTWLTAVSSEDANSVARLYSDDAVLLPTLSPRALTTPQDRLDYFKMFTSKPEIQGTVDEEHIRLLGQTAINSGLYTFTYKEGDKIVSVPARYTFVYQRMPIGWKIIEHHSSRLP